MSRPETNGRSGAPTLENFFSEFTRAGALNYCVVCLRTEKERRLVKNRAFKKFSAAMRIEKNWLQHHVCYMCEKQAVNALRFFKAAMFAAAIDSIFAELVYQKNGKNIDVFQKGNFKQIVKKLKMNAKTCPTEWEKQLLYIRSTSELRETEPLVVDSHGLKNQAQVASQPDEIYVLPDIDPGHRGQVTAMASRCNGETSGGYEDRETQQSSDSFLLRSAEPKISETLVILDEDESDPLQIRIEKVESKANDLNPSQSTSHQQPILQQILLQPELNNLKQTAQGTPRLVPLENLLETPKEIFTGDSLLIGTPDGNYTLHPIAIKEGITTIPSLDAKLINGQLIIEKYPKSLPITENKMLKSMIQQSVKDVVTPSTNINPKPSAPNKTQNTVFTQPSVQNMTPNKAFTQPSVPNMTPNKAFTQPNVPNKAQSCAIVTPTIDNTPKTVKRDSKTTGAMKYEVNCKKSKPQDVSTSSEDNKSENVDWEDKIPMDVISFVDAVDPNRDPNLRPIPVKPASPTATPGVLYPIDFIDLS